MNVILIFDLVTIFEKSATLSNATVSHFMLRFRTTIWRGEIKLGCNCIRLCHYLCVYVHPTLVTNV